MNHLTKVFFSRLLYLIGLAALLVATMTCNHAGDIVEVEDPNARIIPGKSVDGIKLGDSRETVEAKLGKPYSIGWVDGLYRGWRHYYYKEEPHAGLQIVFLDYGATYGPVDVLVIGETYSGKTKEGIGTGSSRFLLHRAYGTPNKSISKPEDNWIADFFCINNKKFEVHYKDNLVTTMAIGYFLPMSQDPYNPCN